MNFKWVKLKVKLYIKKKFGKKNENETEVSEFCSFINEF